MMPSGLRQLTFGYASTRSWTSRVCRATCSNSHLGMPHTEFGPNKPAEWPSATHIWTCLNQILDNVSLPSGRQHLTFGDVSGSEQRETVKRPASAHIWAHFNQNLGNVSLPDGGTFSSIIYAMTAAVIAWKRMMAMTTTVIAGKIFKLS